MEHALNSMSYLSANINRNANDHGRNGNASNEGNSHRSTNQCAQLPKNFLLTAPRLLAPKCAARGAAEETYTKVNISVTNAAVVTRGLNKGKSLLFNNSD